MSKNIRRSIVIVICGALLAILGYIAYQGRIALVASRDLGFGKQACLLIHDYVVANNGSWPRSWDDLADFPHNLNNDDSTKTFREVITVDFSASEADLAQSDLQNFNAIRPKNETIQYDEELKEYWEIPRLLETLRSFHAKQGDGN